MRSLRSRQPVLALLTALGVGLATAPFALADPDGTDPGAPGPAAVATPAADEDQDNGAASSACSEMSGAMAYAANYYSDFANDMSVAQGDYGNIYANDSNNTGRTALRMAAEQANDAANTPGLSPELSDPMHAWSADALKLMLMMGLHVGQDQVNGKANDLNADASKIRFACARAGTIA